MISVSTLNRAADVLGHLPAALVADLEGTLMPIDEASDPSEWSRAREALAVLSKHLPLVAVVSGRPLDQVAKVVDLPSVLCIGNNGLRWTRAGREQEVRLNPADVEQFEQACQRVRPFLRTLEGVRVQRTEVALTIEYRGAAFPRWTRSNVLTLLQPLAALGLIVIEGRRMVELRPRGAPGKSSVLTRVTAEHGLNGLVYIGDDRMDLGAFATLRELRQREEIRTLSIAVLNHEAAAAVPESADATLPSPESVVEMMRELAAHHLHVDV